MRNDLHTIAVGLLTAVGFYTWVWLMSSLTLAH